jgi:predicted nucleic acid-binding protein
MRIEKIYIDTSAFYALIDRSDSCHEAAKALWPSLIKNEINLLTSSYVVSETMTILQKRLGQEAACLWHKAVLGVVDIQWVDRSLHTLGYELWQSLGRLGFSLIDCVGHILMNQHQVTRAFCFKTHYARQGIAMVPEKLI